MDFRKLFAAFHRKEEDGTEPKKGTDKTGWILLVLLGLLFLVIALPTGDGEEKKAADSTANTQTEGRTNVPDEKSEMEERLELALSNMEGVGKVQVMITYKDSGTQVVEKDGGSSSNRTTETDESGGTREIMEQERDETTVYDAGGEGEPFIAKELTPEIEGILIVAEGGGNTAVKQNISNAVLALFPVEAHKIMVVKMND